MREIKFRIYFKDEEKFMTKPITLEDLLHEDGIEFENEEKTLTLPLKDFKFYYNKNENYEIMQYTGLKDKNGKEIYEGDVVKFDYRQDENFEIVFEDGAFWIRSKYTEYVSLHEVIEICKRPNNWQIEVVGNIYDNPELL